MSHTSKIFEEAPIKVQNRNGFDLSHLTCGTSKTGQLVPVLCKLLPPNSSFTLGVNMEVSLPPLATPFYGRVDAIVEGFVIYLSQLYGGWKQFISNQQSTMFPENQNVVESAGGYALPKFDLFSVRESDVASFQTLYDSNDNIYEYLGIRSVSSPGGSGSSYLVSMLQGLAYHFCWDTFYRNKNVTRTIFSVNGVLQSSANPQPSGSSYVDFHKNVSLIWHSFLSDTPLKAGVSVGSFAGPFGSPFTADSLFSLSGELTFPDGVSFFSTRQRNYSRDYFTAASVNPQQGRASSLSFDVASPEGEAAFTIGSLRAANALQKFLETNNLSADYADMMRNRWGSRPIDADFDEPYYLGRVVLPVYQHSVLQNQQTSSDYSGGAVNPFVKSGALGARGASGGMKGEGSITDKFICTSWAFVMALFSLVPHAMYGNGINRELTMTKLGDFPAPELQAIGNEAIKSEELMSEWADYNSAFGYIPRYSRFKYIDDSVHGELRPGKTLESFVLQRRLSSSAPVKLTTSFLEIPQNALDSVFAVDTNTMNLSCWYEIFFEFKVSMPLADFCIPTLGDIQDTHTQKTTVGGSRL